MATFVYVISGDHGRQKIGVSDDPRRRIAELQTGSPFNLSFEFIGQTDGTGYDIEGEAHFLLNKHKAPGGDEWFIVPPEVAITAVMAGARQRGHSIKPIDPDNLPAVTVPRIGPPVWERWIKRAVAIAGFYPMILLIMSFEREHFPLLTFAIEAVALLLTIKLAQWLAVLIGRSLIQIEAALYGRTIN